MCEAHKHTHASTSSAANEWVYSAENEQHLNAAHILDASSCPTLPYRAPPVLRGEFQSVGKEHNWRDQRWWKRKINDRIIFDSIRTKIMQWLRWASAQRTKWQNHAISCHFQKEKLLSLFAVLMIAWRDAATNNKVANEKPLFVRANEKCTRRSFFRLLKDEIAGGIATSVERTTALTLCCYGLKRWTAISR